MALEDQMVSDIEFLRTITIFKNLSSDQHEQVLQMCHPREFKKGSVLYAEGTKAITSWLLKEGLVRVVKYGHEGQSLTLELIAPGEMFGGICTLDGGPYPCTGIALSDVTVYQVLASDFARLVKEHKEVEEAIFAEARRRLRTAQMWRSLLQEPVERRVLHVLIELTERFGTTIPLTRRDIADMAGTTVETAIRILSNLTKQGLISSGRGRIQIDAADALQDHLDTLPHH